MVVNRGSTVVYRFTIILHNDNVIYGKQLSYPFFCCAIRDGAMKLNARGECSMSILLCDLIVQAAVASIVLEKSQVDASN